MKVVPNYASSAFIVPGAVRAHIKDADKTALACLLYVMANNEFNIKTASEELGISDNDLIAALKKWEDAGVLSLHPSNNTCPAENSNGSAVGSKSSDDTAVASKRKMHLSPTLPAYTTEEIVRFLESNASVAEIIASCENVLGKIFTTAETNIIIGLLDHLSLSGDYILLLFAHAAKNSKKSVRYVEKMALSFVDRDITKYHELEEELAKIDRTDDGIKHIRSLFGLGSRALTTKETKMITDWYVTWNMSDEMINKAYEITANTTGDASLNYANKILKNWHEAGISTPEEADRSSAEFEKSKKGSKPYRKSTGNVQPSSSSFDTDDFFEAALKRSFDEDI